MGLGYCSKVVSTVYGAPYLIKLQIVAEIGHVNESCPTWMSRVTHVNLSRHTWMDRVAQMSESCLAIEETWLNTHTHTRTHTNPHTHTHTTTNVHTIHSDTITHSHFFFFLVRGRMYNIWKLFHIAYASLFVKQWSCTPDLWREKALLRKIVLIWSPCEMLLRCVHTYVCVCVCVYVFE